MKRNNRLSLILGAALLAALLIACSGNEVVEPQTEATSVLVEPTPLPAATAVGTLPPPVVVAEGGDSAESPPPPSSEEMPAEQPLWSTDWFGYGVQSHAKIGDPAFTMDVVANQLNMEWVKVQLRWHDIETAPDTFDWAIWDSIVNEAERQNLYLMFSVVTSPDWARADGKVEAPPDDYNQYYQFLTDVLTRYDGRVHAIEVWNEQNIIREWDTPDGANPQAYVNFLEGAYRTIKSVAPEVIVISGALAPTGVHDEFNSWDDFIYLDQMIALGMLDFADCLGAHHNGYNIPPDIGFDETDRMGSPDDFNFKGPMTNVHHSWSFKTTLDVYADKIEAVKPGMKLCVTEFGWPSSEGYTEFPQSFEFALDNTLAEQAQFIVQAFEQMHDSGDVWLAFLFNYDYGNKGNGPTDDNVPYSIIDTNGVPRPAFFALGDMEKVR
jgi:hypothetical protein